jgi:hypothetical protein
MAGAGRCGADVAGPGNTSEPATPMPVGDAWSGATAKGYATDAPSASGRDPPSTAKNPSASQKRTSTKAAILSVWHLRMECTERLRNPRGETEACR